MEDNKKNINIMLKSIDEVLVNENYKEDFDLLIKLKEKLKNTDLNTSTLEYVEDINKDIDYIEDKYFYDIELSYYFNFIYSYIKRRTHDEYVRKLREENRKKNDL